MLPLVLSQKVWEPFKAGDRAKQVRLNINSPLDC